MATAALPERLTRDVRAGVRVEQLTVGWMTLEALLSIGAGVTAGSVLLTAFGLDSVIELVTGAVLLWRLAAEARGAALEHVEQAERRAAWVTGVGLGLLCLYVVASAAASLLGHREAETSWVGLAVAAAAVVGMPLLARRKRAIAARIGSAALRADAACSVTCAYMAGTMLVGLAANALLGWWWADGLAALVFLRWLVPEAREALAAARAGRAACCCADGCD
ncbi:MAG TPA: cation transporter [Chloroflexota bacterium]|nr:cation transporter [Chloroflexota bacterium]